MRADRAEYDGVATVIDYESQNPEHVRSFGNLNREWLTKYFYVEPQDEAAFADPEGAVIERGGLIVFACVDGVIVGTGSLLPLEEGNYELAKMAVTEAHQGKGLGALLVKVLIARARLLGARRLFIVSNTALDRAIRLYRRYGFRDSAQIRHAHYARGNITLELDLHP